MRAPLLNRKKLIETQYLEEARRASSIFPAGSYIPHEKPDFLASDGKIGIEVTELCREEQRKKAGKLAKVPDKAKTIYDRFPRAEPVDVIISFSQTETIRSNVLAQSLADYVYANRASKGTSFNRALPLGYCHIGIHEPLTSGGSWSAIRAFDTIAASKELLENRIPAKNGNVPDYRLTAPELWLLIVSDQFLGPGEVYARPDDLALWKFLFDFDKVLLFSREPGGTGDVIEIQRA